MTALLHTLVALVLLNVLHLSAAELAAQWLRVRIMAVHLGVGPRLFSIGRVHMHLLPVAGSVRVKDSRDTTYGATDEVGALDRAPRWVQALLPLAGPLAVALVALVLMGASEGLAAIGRGFVQWIVGAVTPLGGAQGLIGDYVAFAGTRPLPAVIGLVAAKLAALNLLPLPAMGGGQALLVAIGALRRGAAAPRDGDPPAALEAPQWAHWLWLLLLASWALALGAWLLRSA